MDRVFWERLCRLAKIVFPSMKSREARYVYLLTVLLVARTLMSIWLADVNGKVVKAIVNKSFSEFLKRVSTISLTFYKTSKHPCFLLDLQPVPVCGAKFDDKLGD